MSLDGKHPEPNEPDSPESDGELRNSLAELEHELANLLDHAPLLPDDDDEGSGVDFEPPAGLRGSFNHSTDSPAASATEVSVQSPAVASSQPTEQRADAPASEGDPRDARPNTSPPPSASPPEPRRDDANSPNGSRHAQGAHRDVPPDSSDTQVPATKLEATRTADHQPGRAARVRTVATLILIVAMVGLGWFSNAWWGTESKKAARPAGELSALKAMHHQPQPSGSITAPPSTAAAAAVPSAVPAPSVVAAPRQPEQEPASPFSSRQALIALAPAGIEASRCRRSRDPAGRVYVKVVIGEGGVIESVFAGPVYKDSETLKCIERKLQAVALPRFSGAGGEVILPVVLK